MKLKEIVIAGAFLLSAGKTYYDFRVEQTRIKQEREHYADNLKKIIEQTGVVTVKGIGNNVFSWKQVDFKNGNLILEGNDIVTYVVHDDGKVLQIPIEKSTDYGGDGTIDNFKIIKRNRDDAKDFWTDEEHDRKSGVQKYQKVYLDQMKEISDKFGLK